VCVHVMMNRTDESVGGSLQGWVCWWDGCRTPTTWTSLWWASWTARPLKALSRSWVDQTRIKPLWLLRRARAGMSEWLSSFSPRWLDVVAVSLKATAVRATSAAWKLELTWFSLMAVFMFIVFLGAWREQGFQPEHGSKPKEKVHFCDLSCSD